MNKEKINNIIVISLVLIGVGVGYYVGDTPFDDALLFTFQIGTNDTFSNIVYEKINVSWNYLVSEGVVNDQGLVNVDMYFWDRYMEEKGIRENLDWFDGGYANFSVRIGFTGNII